MSQQGEQIEPAQNQPIIIKKKKGEHHAAHGGAWKVAYADFVTAMMALFIVLWILGQSKEVKDSVASYFKDPIGFSERKGRNVIDLGGAGKNPEKQNPTNPVLTDSAKKVLQEMEKMEEKKALVEMGKKILLDISNNPEFEEIKDKVKMSLVEEGLKIEMLESDNFFFEIGTAKITKEANSLLKKIGEQFADLQQKIIVEGHTDARPYPNNGTGYTNFELSVDRANAARRALISGGLDLEKVDEVRGYADTRLKNPDEPFNSINRRISIIVKYLK